MSHDSDQTSPESPAPRSRTALLERQAQGAGDRADGVTERYIASLERQLVDERLKNAEWALFVRRLFVVAFLFVGVSAGLVTAARLNLFGMGEMILGDESSAPMSSSTSRD